MILSELYDLREYIQSECNVTCIIGERDTGADEMPIVKIIPNESMTFFYHNAKLTNIDLPVQLRIIVDKQQELKALEVLEKIVLKANQYHQELGHTLSDTGEPEYVDDTKTYEIAVMYNMKLLVQDTN